MKSLFRLLRAFKSGLDRSLIIINHGDVPVWRVIEKAEMKYPYSKKHFRSVRFFLYLARAVLRGKNKKYKIDTKHNLLYCGTTKNNIREFLFLDDYLPAGENYDDSKNLPFIDREKVADSYSLLSKKLFMIVLTLNIAFRCKINPTLTQYIISYIIEFSLFYCTFVADRKYVPALAIVSNDHHHNPIAFCKIMEYLNVPRVYVQHAEVSSQFPPLDFEITVLRNKVSADIYRAIETPKFQPYIISRYKTSNDVYLLKASLDEPVEIVIYLSSLFIVEEVNKALDALNKNRGVKNVGIKLHPGTDPNKVDFGNNVRVYQVIPEFKHLAIVPNSSVVIELLYHGIHVMQYFKLDDIKEDYYGFVAAGVTLALDFNSLSGEFWKGVEYTDDMLSAYSHYNPCISEDQASEEKRLKSKLKSILLTDS